MTLPARFTVGALLVLVLGPAAAEEARKVPAPAPKAGAMQPVTSGAAVASSKPDLKVVLTDSHAFVMNIGPVDYTGPLDVDGTCTSTAPNPPANVCGSMFPGGKLHFHTAHFPAGHGQPPAASVAPGPAMSGPGWLAIPLGLPAGGFEVTVKADTENKVAETNEANNKATRTISTGNPTPTPGIPVHVPTLVLR